MIENKERERVIEEKPATPQYPYIGYHAHSSNPLMVIFTKPGWGVCIKEGSDTSYKIGDVKNYSEYNFNKYEKELVLWNVE